MAYGLWMNGKELAAVNSISLLANDKEPWADGNKQKIYTPPDYVAGNPVFLVGQTGYIFGSQTNPPSYGGVTGWRTDGGRIIVDFTNANQQAFFTEFSLYQVQPPQSVSGTYGIMIQNSVDWMSINSSSRLGFVTWKGDVTINGKWTLPVVQNDNTKVVFVRCDDPGVSIYHAVQYNELTVSRDNGSGEAVLTTANVKVVIMNSGYYPPTPSGYGMVIKNAAGNNTFTSDTEPLVWDGRSVNVGRNPEDLVDTGIARPMIPLAVNAFMRGNSEMSGGVYNYYSCGYRFNGSAVQFWRSESGRKIQTKWNTSNRWYSSQMPLMVINADHYF